MTVVNGIIDIADKIIVTRWLRAPDEIEVTIDRRKAYAAQATAGRVLYLPAIDFSAPLAFLIEIVEYDRDPKTNQLVLHGRTLDGIALGDRLAVPDPDNYPADTAGHDEQTSVPAETAFKHYVDKNGGPGAHVDRQVPGFVIATDAGLGSDVSVSARYQYVQDVGVEICLAADIGWECVFDPATGDHVLDVIIPRDLSSSVFLDTEFDTISEWHQIQSLAGTKSLAIVGGQGELTDRDIVIRPAVEPTGLDRREVFVEAKDVASGATAILQQRGDSTLAGASPQTSVTVTARNEGVFQYPTDYQLGDYVLARDRESGVAEAKQIIGVKITVDKSAAVPTIEPILDKAAPSTRQSSSSFSGGKVDVSVPGGGSGGGGLTNIDGGAAGTVYGGTTGVDGGSA